LRAYLQSSTDTWTRLAVAPDAALARVFTHESSKILFVLAREIPGASSEAKTPLSPLGVDGLDWQVRL
jgi:hypothetical protein